MASLTSSEMVFESDPPVLVAVIVKLPAAVIAVGVPVIAQVVSEKFSPVGSAVEMEQESIAPPELAGPSVAIAEFLG